MSSVIATLPRGSTGVETKFGPRLRELRLEKLRLSQHALARALDLSDSHLAKIESGERRPPNKALFYAQLRAIPGLEETDFDALMASEDAPQMVFRVGQGAAAGPGPNGHRGPEAALQVAIPVPIGGTAGRGSDDGTEVLIPVDDDSELIMRLRFPPGTEDQIRASLGLLAKLLETFGVEGIDYQVRSIPRD